RGFPDRILDGERPVLAEHAQAKGVRRRQRFLTGHLLDEQHVAAESRNREPNGVAVRNEADLAHPSLSLSSGASRSRTCTWSSSCPCGSAASRAVHPNRDVSKRSACDGARTSCSETCNSDPAYNRVRS